MTENSSEQIPLLTFNSLYNILREEKKKNALQHLPEKFYEALKKFFDDKKKEVEKLKTQNEDTKLKKELLILKNSKKIYDELLSLRYSKIANIGIKNSLQGEKILLEENILEKEEKFLKTVKEEISIIKNGN